MKEREELITPHALINIKKKYIKIGVFLWWTIKGLSRCLKKMQAFSEPLQGSRARQSKNKGIHKGCLYFWWTIRDSKPGTIAKMKQKQAKNMQKVPVLRVVPQLCPNEKP